MRQRRSSDQSLQSLEGFYDLENNRELALKVFNSYYRGHTHSGKIFEDFPDFFLVNPEVFDGQEIASRPAEKAMIDETVKRAKARNGYIGVTKHRNPKLGYFWLELTVQPFMLGDAVTENNRGEFFFLITHFIEFTRQNPKKYGDLTADIATDKDLAIMFSEINKMALRLQDVLALYSEDKLVSFNLKWPVAQVKKLLTSLKNSDLEWCELFFEYLIYVMSQKSKG